MKKEKKNKEIYDKTDRINLLNEIISDEFSKIIL